LWIRCYLNVQIKTFDPQESSNLRESFIATIFCFTQDRPVRESVPRCFQSAPKALRSPVPSVDIARFARLRIGVSTWRPPARARAPAARRTGFALVA
jgi:hypothetical protein